MMEVYDGNMNALKELLQQFWGEYFSNTDLLLDLFILTTRELIKNGVTRC